MFFFFFFFFFFTSKAKIGNIINKKGENRHSLAAEGKNLSNNYPKKKRSSLNITKMKSLVVNQNSPIQKFVTN